MIVICNLPCLPWSIDAYVFIRSIFKKLALYFLLRPSFHRVLTKLNKLYASVFCLVLFGAQLQKRFDRNNSYIWGKFSILGRLSSLNGISIYGVVSLGTF